MRRASVFLAVSAALSAVACSKLFGDATQCTTDGECAGFADAVCDVAQGVCISSSSLADGGPTEEGTAPDAGNPNGEDASESDGSLVDAFDSGPDPCAVANKPQVEITGTAGAPLGDGGPTVDITKDLSLVCTNDYVLKGDVVVRPGATLTIAKGTTVKGDNATHGALYVLPGGKLNANGTAEDAVVFTSSQQPGGRLPNDWGGLVILGSAGPAGQINANPALAYGGGAATSSSGTLNYVRVEYSGSPLVMAGVGSGTKVDFVQVRRTLDNCFRWKGGTVKVKHAACQSPRGEAFEFSGGYLGKAQFLIAQRRASAPDRDGLLIDGSNLAAFNVTLCGDAQANIGYGLLPKNGTQMHVANLIVAGYSAGMVIFAPIGTPFDLRSAIFQNSENPAYVAMAGVTDVTSPYYDHAPGFDSIAWFNDVTHKNTIQDPGLNCLASSPVFGPAMAFTGLAETPPADGFFDPVAYIGAVKDVNDTWATGPWTDWSAQ